MPTFGLYMEILGELGVPLTGATKILDWGCGAGALVAEGRAEGYDVVGCDFDVPDGTPYLLAIDASAYRLPYPDHAFDIIISASVLEHVMDYTTSLKELQRVLRPGGRFLHMFPSRGAPIEPHVFVPGATVLRSRSWLLLWAALGVRNSFQRGLSAAAVARINYQWLHAHTNYLSRSEIVSRLSAYFADVRFVESIMLRHSPNVRGRRVSRISRALPFLSTLYSTFRNRVVFGRAKTSPDSTQ